MVEFSLNTRNMRSSEIRRLMKLAADPSVISFAGGMPANELFPIQIVDELYRSLPDNVKRTALQYGPTYGYPPLVESLRTYLQSRGLPLEGQRILVTAGAQQAINILTKVLIDPGDYIVTEYPAFIGAIAAFNSYTANLAAVPLQEDGIDSSRFEEVLQTHSSAIKMIYLSPYFHNPAGIIYSEQRKKEVLDLLDGRPHVLLEDDPYGELYFNEADKPLTRPMKSIADPSRPICYVGSFAKIFGPGLRLGWMLGPEAIVEKCEMAKQSMDACSSTLSQVLAHEYLSRGKLSPYLEELRPAYARRARLMIEALERYMPEGISWTHPRGGFYVWLTMPSGTDATEVFNRSISRGAAFVVGNAFDPHGKINNSMRLAFSFTPEEKIEHGIAIIANAIQEVLPG